MDARRGPFGSLLTAVITPFDGDGAVDYQAFWRLLLHLQETGTDAVVVCGTTGEGPTLTDEEKLALFSTAVDAAAGTGGAMKVVASTGTYDTAHSVELTRRAAEIGCDGVMLVTPYYSKPPQEGLYRHFVAIADASELPVLLYNIPGRTARLIDVDTLVRLAGHPNIVAVKDAVDDLDYTKRSLAELPGDFAVYAGSDAFAFDSMQAGGVGVVSVASHLVGLRLKAMIEALLEGEVDTASAVNTELAPLFAALFVEPNPMPLKAALNRWWGPVGDPRLPLIPASDETVALLEAALIPVAVV
ncbi:MAG: 4-hydroxy-tetrahydrodipicolinate synthase [Acidimicrobiia bacterium]